LLTSDLVRVRRREGALHAQYVRGEAAARLLPTARAYVELYKRMIGEPREDIDAAVEAIEVAARDRLTAQGLRKVLDDRCEYEGPAGIDPEEVRREVFLAAAAAQRALDVRAELDRAAVLAEVAAKLGRTPEELEAAMYSDLRGAEVLRKAWTLGAEALIERYNVALAQSILLRATRVTVVVSGETPDRYRRLFRTMRFLGLLYQVTPHVEGAGDFGAKAAQSQAVTNAPRSAVAANAPTHAAAASGKATMSAPSAKAPTLAAAASGKAKVSAASENVAALAQADSGKTTVSAPSKKAPTPAKKGKKARVAEEEAAPSTVYSIVIDGPFSLFGPSLKYGMRLATMLHAVLSCGRFVLNADVVWGPRREAATFRVAPEDGLVPHAGELPSSSPVLDTFVASFEKLGSDWKVARNDRIFPVPGEAAAIPDLLFSNERTGEEMFFEAFGFWSRAAVWTRVEQIRRGALPVPLLLAVSKELRVSSEVLEAEDAGEVYVYKATMLPRAVLERLEKKGKRA